MLHNGNNNESNILPFDNTGLKGNQIFWKYHQYLGNNIPDSISCNKMTSVIKVKEDTQREFKTYTFSPKPPNRKTDDDVYQNHPVLKTLLPRGMTLIFDTTSSLFVTDLTGCLKFSGRNKNDDDDDSDVIIYNHVKAKTWANSKKCTITRTEKANGKFALCKLFQHNGMQYVAFGSKNYHKVVQTSKLQEFIDSCDEASLIVKSIAEDILKNIISLMNLSQHFVKGYSLIGELEDGMHFTPGDNTVAWIGLFKNGVSFENDTIIKMIQKSGLRTVKSSVIFTPDSPIEDFEKAFMLARCSQAEGDVLVIRNVETNESMLCKSKSSVYSTKRMFREKWKSMPQKIFETLPQRFIDTKDYHGLNTDAAIRMTRQLFDFAVWLGITKSYPAAVLDHSPVKAVRGDLENGFNTYFQMFIDETGVTPVLFDETDFGEFNQVDYLTSPLLDIFNKSSVRPLVIFTQDIQGSGKSTITDKLNNIKKVEQDWCYGCTKVTQFQLMYYIRNGFNTLVSRCNIESKQYDAYLKIAQSYDTRIIFVTSNNVSSPLRLAVSLAGIKHRSKEGDMVMVGRKEYPFEEVTKFTTDFWKSYNKHPNAIEISSWYEDEELVELANDVIRTNKMVDFVNTNFGRLMSLRLPLDSIVASYQNLIDNPPIESFVTKTIDKTVYVGLHLVDKNVLVDFVKKNDSYYQSKDKMVCEHLTQIYFAKGISRDYPLVDVGDLCKIRCDAYVINNSNGASAFRVSSIINSSGNEIKVMSGKPHITAMLSNGSKPSESIYFVFSDNNVNIVPCDIIVDALCRYN